MEKYKGDKVCKRNAIFNVRREKAATFLSVTDDAIKLSSCHLIKEFNKLSSSEFSDLSVYPYAFSANQLAFLSLFNR